MDALAAAFSGNKRSSAAAPKKDRKRNEGQRETLLPIMGKKGKEAASKPGIRPSTRQKKAG